MVKYVPHYAQYCRHMGQTCPKSGVIAANRVKKKCYTFANKH